MSNSALPTPPASPTGATHAVDVAMQKYQLLLSQHHELRQHLDQIRSASTVSSTTTRSTTANASFVSSPAVSPTRASHLFGQHPSSRHHRRSSLSGPPKTRPESTALAPLPDESILHELADHERRLFDINEGIKRALMEMLNGEQAKFDGSFRTWVQCRLMATEKELRSERRRKSAP